MAKPKKTQERPPLESFISPIQKDDLKSPGQKIWESLRGDRGEPGREGQEGKPGKDGAEGKQGPRGFTGDDGPMGPQGPKGEKGDKGERGERGFQGIEGRPGKDGKSAREIKEFVLNPADIIEKINKGKLKISRMRIEGMEELENKFESNRRQWQNFLSLGGARQTRISSNGTVVSTGADTINFIGATVATPAGNNGSTVNVTITGSSFAGSTEQSTTSPNGSQQTFAFAHTPAMIFWNGSFQFPTIDYNVSGNNVVFTGSNIPQTGDVIANVYA